MKTLTILALLLTLTVNSQNKIGLQFTQDGKLLFMEDDYGNTPATLDLQSKLVLEVNEGKIGHIQAAVKFEYADLYGGIYKRWGVEVGYSFTNLPIPFTNIKYTLTPLIGHGIISRGSEIDGVGSFEGSLEISFTILKYLDLIILNTATQRNELEDNVWRYNLAAGIQFNIDTNYIKKQAKKGTRF